MKAISSILLTLFTGVLLAQTPVNKTYPVTTGQKISFRFDYPELVKISTWDKNEISIVGTVSINGSHLHLSISDSTGKMIGGHLMPGCKIYTTAEIVIQYSDKYEFTREKDGTTPWEELQIKEK